MTNEPTPTVVLGVSGCIAAYKACEIARALMNAGCRVKVVMTRNATRFVGPTTFRALTGEPVSVSLWDEPDRRVHHIALAQDADVVVIAPATANVLAKLAHGRADDLLTTVALATRAPLVVAPAMNVAMWRAEVTQDNVTTLRSRGTEVVEPATGVLACGDTGEGRLAESDEIIESVLAIVRRSRELDGVNVVVTAGPTREPVDPVRFISNASSGKTGYAIAQEAERRGARVTLISGPTTLPDPLGVDTVRVNTALEMQQAVDSVYADCDVFVASAAVSDFRPAVSSEQKIKKERSELSLQLERNPDILAGAGAEKGGRVLVGFAAETSDHLHNAALKLAAKNLDLVVANDVSDPALGFASDDNRVWFVTAETTEQIERMPKTKLASVLWDRLQSPARRTLAARTEKESS